MKIIKDNRIKIEIKADTSPKHCICRNCKSEFEFDKSDITKGSIFYSEREIDSYIDVVCCPCCKTLNQAK